MMKITAMIFFGFAPSVLAASRPQQDALLAEGLRHSAEDMSKSTGKEAETSAIKVGMHVFRVSDKMPGQIMGFEVVEGLQSKMVYTPGESDEHVAVSNYLIEWKKNYGTPRFLECKVGDLVNRVGDGSSGTIKGFKTSDGAVLLPTEYDVNILQEGLKIASELEQGHPFFVYKGRPVDGISVDGGKSFITLTYDSDLTRSDVRAAFAKKIRYIRFSAWEFDEEGLSNVNPMFNETPVRKYIVEWEDEITDVRRRDFMISSNVQACTRDAFGTRNTMQIIAIRHGQSEWNLAKNNGKWSWNNWAVVTSKYEDAPLTTNGRGDADRLKRFFNGKSSYAREFKRRVDDGQVTFAMSNLQRAQDTLMTGLQGVIKSQHSVYIMSDLQESTGGSDAATTLGEAKMRQRLVTQDEAHSRASPTYDFKYDGGNQWFRAFNGESRAHKALGAFFELKKDIAVFAGHSHAILDMMNMLVPKAASVGEWWAVEHTKNLGVWATKDKLANGGAMEFDVELLEDGRIQIVPGTWDELPGDELPGLLKSKSNKNVLRKMSRAQPKPLVEDPVQSPGQSKSTWTIWPKNLSIGKLSCFRCGSRRRSSAVMDISGSDEHSGNFGQSNPGNPELIGAVAR